MESNCFGSYMFWLTFFLLVVDSFIWKYARKFDFFQIYIGYEGRHIGQNITQSLHWSPKALLIIQISWQNISRGLDNLFIINTLFNLSWSTSKLSNSFKRIKQVA